MAVPSRSRPRPAPAPRSRWSCPPRPPRAWPARPRRGMPKRILLVEDEPGLRLTLSGRLASEGHAVEQAADGETGLARASAEPFDLVVLDVMLPDRSGFEVCRDLRKRGVETPILM